MYDDELNMALEDAYDDGYVQALLDMGVDPDDIAEEDVDIYDDYDEAMEGPAREYRHRMNEGKPGCDIRRERLHPNNWPNKDDPRYSDRSRNLELKGYGGMRHFNKQNAHTAMDAKKAQAIRDARVRAYKGGHY